MSREVEALTNLAQLCLDAGCPAAALKGYAAILGRAASPRVVLSALGGAAIAAARSGDKAVLTRVESEIVKRVGSSGLLYENAQAHYHLAQAYGAIGDTKRRDEHLDRTRQLAKARGFFELLHKADSDAMGRATEPVIPANLTTSARSVVESINDYDIGAGAELLALTRQF